MYIDAHCHIFTERIVANVRAKPAMLAELKLNTEGALDRLPPRALHDAAGDAGIDACMLLPTAAPDKVRRENDRFIGFTEEFSRLRTLATLHPDMPNFEDEIRRVYGRGIRGFKFSSFSQRFDLLSDETGAMLEKIGRLAHERGFRPIALWDTYATAHLHFGANPDHLTTPAKLADLVQRRPEIDFIAAHMGGLAADFDEIRRYLLPSENLYLDTANAAHTLAESRFVELLRIHGPSHILFGTDWPWFLHRPEREKITDLLTKAGFSPSDREAVFGGNAAKLFSIRTDNRGTRRE